MAEFFNISTEKRSCADKAGIELATHVVAVISKDWVDDPIRQEEILYAIRLGKPIAIAVFDDVEWETYMKDAKIMLVRFFNREKMTQNKKLAQELVEDFMVEVTDKLTGAQIR